MIRGVTLMFGNLHITTGLVNFLGTHDVCRWSPDHETLPDLSSICRRIAPWARQKTASPKTQLTRQVVGGLATCFCDKGKMAVGDLFSLLPCPARRDRTDVTMCCWVRQNSSFWRPWWRCSAAKQPSWHLAWEASCQGALLDCWSMGRRVTVMVLSFLSPNVSCDPSSPTIRIYDI